MGATTLSVVTPNYNHAAVLAEGLDALLRQSRPPDEIVVVDDASTDDSVAVVERIAAREPRVRLIRNETNLGPLRATNRGALESRGDCLAFLAADDLTMPGFFEGSMACLERFPRAGICVSDMTSLRPNLELREETLPFPKEPAYFDPDELSRQLHGEYLPIFSSIFRREAFFAAGCFSEDLEEIADWFLVFVVAFRHGLCYQPGFASTWRVQWDSYCFKQDLDRASRRQKLRRLLQKLRQPEYRPLLPHFARSGVFSTYGDRLVEALLECPDEWNAENLMLLRIPLDEYRERQTRRREREYAAGRRPPAPNYVCGGRDYTRLYTAEFLRPRIDVLVAEWLAAARRVLLYGAGEHTASLFRLTTIASAPLIAIADRASALHGEKLWGLEVVAPERIPELEPDVVLISSVSAQDEIYADLRYLERRGIELVRLYGADMNAIDRLEASPPVVTLTA